MKPYENPFLVLVWGFAAGFWLWVSGYDVALQWYLYTTYDQSFNSVMRNIGFLALGRTQVLFVLIAVFIAWCANRRKVARQMMMVLPVLAIAGICQIVLKFLIGRPRPKEILWHGDDPFIPHPMVPDASFWSLPSGHATSTFALCIWLCILFPRFRIVLVPISLVLVSSRFLAVTPHYIGDVVAGAALGTCVSLCCWHVFREKGWV